jgi:hypothetical protein
MTLIAHRVSDTGSLPYILVGFGAECRNIEWEIARGKSVTAFYNKTTTENAVTKCRNMKKTTRLQRDESWKKEIHDNKWGENAVTLFSLVVLRND